MKGFALGLALKQRRKATRKSPILGNGIFRLESGTLLSGDSGGTRPEQRLYLTNTPTSEHDLT